MNNVYKYLDLSTAHITQHDAELLSLDDSLPFRVLTDEYGYFVSVGQPEEFISFTETGLSKDFVNVYKYASKLGCWYINLDRDADIIDNLHVNEW